MQTETAVLLGGSIAILQKFIFKADFTVMQMCMTSIVMTVILRFLLQHFFIKRQKLYYLVLLYCDGKEYPMKALLDTGNTLVEPISGSPVSVAEPETLQRLLGGECPIGCRMVPFCSVGKQHGLMKAYLVKSIWVEVEGCYKECQNVYVGENQEFFKEGCRYQLILNPGILEGGN